MDPQTMMTMFREMIREERKEMMEMFMKHVAGQNIATNEVTSVPNMMSALSNRIEKFVFDPDTGMCFTRWYSRVHDEAVLDREYKAGRKVSLRELYRECENFPSLKKDSETIAGNVKNVEAAVKEERQKRECWNFCGDHFAQQCKSKLWFCKNCKTTGHKERFCEVANQRRTTRSGSEGRRSRQNSDNSRNRGNKKTRRFSGKHVRGVKIANVTAEVNSTRMYVEAGVNQHPMNFLFDTGSDITVLNEDVWRSMGAPRLEKTNVVVKNASGSSVKIHGKLWCEFKIKGSRSEGYAYVTPHNSLLGLEWIQKNEHMSYYIRMMVAEVKEDQNGDVAMKLKKSYLEVFEEGLGLCTKEKVDMQLVGDVRPVFQAFRPVPHAAVEAVEKELDRLLEMNVITPVTHSEWAAPIVCVRKSNGKLRMCADFSTGLNKALESFDYPLPVPEDIFARLNGRAVFSQIGLSDAYLIELSDKSKKMVVINTHRGLFQNNRLTFGIKTAPSIFQQVMNKMVAGLRGVATYLDDILVCGRTEQEHMENLLALFERIAEFGFKPEIRYLGFIVDRNGRRPNPEKIEAIKGMVEPKNVGQLRAFLGMITYYAAFMPAMKDLRGPLDALLTKDVKWEWTSKQQTAFEKLKKALSSELNLAHYDPRQKIVVAADACDYGSGCVISHRYADELRPKVLKELHIGHPGIVRMKKLARSDVYWPNIDSDCEDMVRRCTNCQEAAKNPMKVSLKTWLSPTRVWQRVHVDFAGPLQEIYNLVVVDAFSKWPGMIEMSNISATKTVKALKSLFARYGSPQTIVSDNGTQFTSEQFKAMCDERGIVHIKIAPCHPQSNGQAERFVDTLKRGLKKLKGEERPSDETLNVVLQAYSITPNSSLNEKSPAELFLGRKLRTRFCLLVPQPGDIEDSLAKEGRERIEQQFDRKDGVMKRTFDVGDNVYAKQWKAPHFHWVKGRVVRRIGPVNYEVEINGRIVRKHANQLRCRDKQEDHVQKNESLKVLLEVLAAEDAYTRHEVIVEPNPDRAIPNARLPNTSDATSTMPATQGPPPPTLRRSTRIRRPVQRFDPSPA
ncbi:integrase core domain protein [Ancylostoma duodenale]|uniref:RNA-directed DNA polymerase n=1 Tax=Ancylostoma duodenale TaxID=51022 RepID=A0A0C2HCS8_9BILA|nr:integrase core domain protein [Ancylostoma duodenale]